MTTINMRLKAFKIPRAAKYLEATKNAAQHLKQLGFVAPDERDAFRPLDGTWIHHNCADQIIIEAKKSIPVYYDITIWGA